MEIKYGEGKTEYGPGVEINLTGDEVATAIAAYIVAHGVHYQGPRTITVNGNLCVTGRIYVDPSGFVIDGEGNKFDGKWGEKLDTAPKSKLQGKLFMTVGDKEFYGVGTISRVEIGGGGNEAPSQPDIRKELKKYHP